MNTLIQAHNNKMNRLVNVSSQRRANELDFFTECSIKYQKYLNAPLALNPVSYTHLTLPTTPYV